MHNFFSAFLSQMRDTGILEWLAVIFGLLEVSFALYDRIWLYPAGIISTVVSIYLLINVELYADSLGRHVVAGQKENGKLDFPKCVKFGCYTLIIL